MTKKEIALKAIEALKKEYPDNICSLEYTKPIELLIATRLAAQCTDARVNIVAPVLFKKYKNVDELAKAEVKDVEDIVKTCGLYRTKAKDIVNMSIMIKEDFNGEVPDNMEDLLKLPGIGRKTANLIMGDVYGKPAIVVDTHFMRITRRLGLHNILKDATKIEFALKKILPENESNDFCHRLVLHGRAVCKARNPICEDCVMKDFCKKNI